MIFILLTIVLTVGLVGVNIGAPYKAIGFIKESNNVGVALNVIFDRIIVRLSPKNARIAFNLRLAGADLNSPEEESPSHNTSLRFLVICPHLSKN